MGLAASYGLLTGYTQEPIEGFWDEREWTGILLLTAFTGVLWWADQLRKDILSAKFLAVGYLVKPRADCIEWVARQCHFPFDHLLSFGFGNPRNGQIMAGILSLR